MPVCRSSRRLNLNDFTIGVVNSAVAAITDLEFGWDTQ